MIEEYGRWEGTKFIFHEPLEYVDQDGKAGRLATLETAGMQLAPGLTRDEVIEALIQPIKRVFRENDTEDPQ